MFLVSAAEFGIDLGKHVGDGSSSFTLVEALVPLVAVIMVFGMPIVIVLAVLRYRANRQRSINEMVLKLADKGQPIPPELFMEPTKKKKSDVSSGLSLVGAGVGLMGFFWFADAAEAVGIGFIPLAIGVGQLIAWKIEQQKKDL
ncbi:DUF6249 domain-containing protein [Nevskia sp.]|uniref:DUF6249 domain-containing protein n=1 Tax=Nevskia sp. TaxID=1929292 RepID=UPI0025F7EF02|nr:DUF6249 domain-containing protein [Nevskia sp.]